MNVIIKVSMANYDAWKETLIITFILFVFINEVYFYELKESHQQDC